MADQVSKKSKPARKLTHLPLRFKVAAGVALAALAIGAGVLGVTMSQNKGPEVEAPETQLLAAFWPDAFNETVYNEPEFVDDENRTNNAFNVQDFGEQGTNGWFYRYGKSKAPWKSQRIEGFDGEKYYQRGANGLEIKKNFLHTSEAAAPILEWRAAEDGEVNITLTYVKNVNGDKNPGYPDGVQLSVYKGKEFLALENVDISVTEENLAQIKLEKVPVTELESLYFIVDPRTNNAFDGGSLYVLISDVNAEGPKVAAQTGRKDNNANNLDDFGEQGKNGWCYMFGNSPADAALVSHELDGEYTNATSPNLSESQYFIHPAINDNAILSWTPAVSGVVDLRVKYSKYEQHDGNPNFPDGVKVKVYKNDELLYEQHVDAPSEGENKIKFRAPKLSVKPSDRLYFMVDAEGNASYDGGGFDITVIDINGKGDESAVYVEEPEVRQNFADVSKDFGKQGSNGWIFQSGYEDEPYTAVNMTAFDQKEDRYFEDNYLEIKRDYVNPGEHGRSAVIKWRVAQNGTIRIDASYTKMKNEDKNPAWPDGTRVTLYHNGTKLAQQTFAPEVSKEVTKRLDVSSVNVKRGEYITMVINGLDNIAYDGGKYEFKISSLTGLVGNNERNVPATFNGKRTNFASTMDDFGKQGYNGWYYQYTYNRNVMGAINVEKCENNEKYYTSDGIEIKKDFIVPSNTGKNAVVKWVAAENGTINIDLQYTKLVNEDKNPSWPDGVTVYLMKNGTVLKEQRFLPLTDREVTKDLSMKNVAVAKGDAISMLVDPGANGAYDAGKYSFVIEDVTNVPVVKVGNNDNNTSLGELKSMTQGVDGWWFLEGTSPADAKVLTKMNDDKSAFVSRRSEGLEMKKDYVHAGTPLDPIYQFVVGENGKVDVAGSYMKFGQNDPNPDWPDGVTLKIWHNSKLLQSTKVKVLRGDGNNNVVAFNFNKLDVKRGDKLSFQICADKNYAWDAGSLSVAIEKSTVINLKPGDDNNSVLKNIDSVAQGTDGWWFMEGTTIDNAKLLTNISGDKSAYTSVKDTGLEVKKDYVHPGAVQSPIYKWVVAENGKLDVKGSYVKFGHNDGNPDWPDGVTVSIYQNSKQLLKKKVAALKGDGNDNVLDFKFDQLTVKKGDVFSFMISADSNNAWDAGRLSVVFGEEPVTPPSEEDNDPIDPNRTNNTNLKDSFGEQGNDGWYYGMCEWNGTSFEKLPYDAANNRYMNNGAKPEVKADFVEPGNGKNAAYKWIAAKEGTIVVSGEYVKFANSADANANGTCMRIFLNGEEKSWMGTQGNFGEEKSVTFEKECNVKPGSVLIFAIDPDGNDSYDGGRLSVTIKDKAETTPEQPENPEEPKDPEEPEDTRTNNTSLKDSFGEQGKDGWYYGMCDWDSQNFSLLPFDAGLNRYYNNGAKPELKADFVEPGSFRNAAYKWVAAKDGVIRVSGDYVKFPNNADPNADGTCVRIFLNGAEKKWMGTMGNFDSDQQVFFDEEYTVKAGDEIIFAVSPENNDSYDSGRLTINITAK